jgi:CelD/BcsL family acetyltransferase involved in cellulose biosynthesis
MAYGAVSEGITPDVQVDTIPWTMWAQIRPRWAELASIAPIPSFFLSADWVEAWLSVFGKTLQPTFLLFQTADATVGICMLVRRRDLYGLLPVQRLYLNTAGEDERDSACVEFNDVLCREGYESAVAAAMHSHLSRLRWDEFIIDGCQSSIVLEELGKAFKAAPQRVKEGSSHYVALSQLRREGKEYAQTLSRNLRSQIRRSCSLYEEQGKIITESASNVDAAMEMLEELSRLHQTAWKARGKPGAFGSEAFRAFHRNLIRNTFPCGKTHLLRVRTDAETIGILYNFAHEGKVYFYQSGFNYVTDNRYRPGMVTFYHAIEHYMAEGWDEFDFLAGESPYKQRLATHARLLRWVRIERGTPAIRAVQALRSLKRRSEAVRHRLRPEKESKFAPCE